MRIRDLYKETLTNENKELKIPLNQHIPLVMKTFGQLELTKQLRKRVGLPKDAPVYFDDADLVYGDKTVWPQCGVDEKCTFGDAVKALKKFAKANPLGDKEAPTRARRIDPNSVFARLGNDIQSIMNDALDGNDMADTIADELGDYLRNGDAPKGSHYEKAISIVMDALHDGPKAQAEAAEEAISFLHSEETNPKFTDEVAEDSDEGSLDKFRNLYRKSIGSDDDAVTLRELIKVINDDSLWADEFPQLKQFTSDSPHSGSRIVTAKDIPGNSADEKIEALIKAIDDNKWVDDTAKHLMRSYTLGEDLDDDYGYTWNCKKCGSENEFTMTPQEKQEYIDDWEADNQDLVADGETGEGALDNLLLDQGEESGMHYGNKCTKCGTVAEDPYSESDEELARIKKLANIGEEATAGGTMASDVSVVVNPVHATGQIPRDKNGIPKKKSRKNADGTVVNALDAGDSFFGAKVAKR